MRTLSSSPCLFKILSQQTKQATCVHSMFLLWNRNMSHNIIEDTTTTVDVTTLFGSRAAQAQHIMADPCKLRCWRAVQRPVTQQADEDPKLWRSNEHREFGDVLQQHHRPVARETSVDCVAQVPVCSHATQPDTRTLLESKASKTKTGRSITTSSARKAASQKRSRTST